MNWYGQRSFSHRKEADSPVTMLLLATRNNSSEALKHKSFQHQKQKAFDPTSSVEKQFSQSVFFLLDKLDKCLDLWENHYVSFYQRNNTITKQSRESDLKATKGKCVNECFSFLLCNQVLFQSNRSAKWSVTNHLALYCDEKLHCVLATINFLTL